SAVPPVHVRSLLLRAQERYGGTAAFVGSGDETELAAQAAAHVLGPCCDLVGCTTLPQLTALLSLADVMLANDTGPLHLAAALGRPVVAPYTCTKVHMTGPYGAANGAVQ